jgi:hypothetical protein
LRCEVYQHNYARFQQRAIKREATLLTFGNKRAFLTPAASIFELVATQHYVTRGAVFCHPGICQ